MSKKSRLFLLCACIALVVSLLRFVHGSHVTANVGDFAAGFSVAMLIGTMVTWNNTRGTTH